MSQLQTHPAQKNTQAERSAAAIASLQQAALEIIAESGCGAITMAKLGERAGVSQGLALYHFGNKHNLMKSLFDQATNFIKSLEFDPPWGNHTGITAACDLLDWNIERIKNNPMAVRGHFTLILEASVCSKLNLTKEVNEYTEISIGFTAGLLQDDLNRATDISSDPKVLASIITGAYRGIISQWLADDSFDVITALDSYKRLLVKSLTAPAAN